MNANQLASWKASRKRKRDGKTALQWFEDLKSGDRSSLSAAITILESTRGTDRLIANELIQLCTSLKSKSIRVGITGIPGVGKSSFLEKFGLLLIEKGYKLAILAIDPSSERTGGSILGDKTRMFELSPHESAFIRPSAAGSSLGGVARKTRESILLCEAAGYDFICIETVGVGQSETMVHSMVDFFLLLLISGAGDELQGIKRGIMEMADGLIVTKADGDNHKRAQLTARELKNAIHLFPPTESTWIPRVEICSAQENHGLDSILETINSYTIHTKSSGFFDYKRHSQEHYWMNEAFQELINNYILNNSELGTLKNQLEGKLQNQSISGFEAATVLFKQFISKL
jgi:LAO/AO transport system kinase